MHTGRCYTNHGIGMGCGGGDCTCTHVVVIVEFCRQLLGLCFRIWGGGEFRESIVGSNYFVFQSKNHVVVKKEIQEIIASSVSFFNEKQRRFKFGGCPKHLSLSLRPHATKSGPQRGHLLLRCKNFWKRGDDDKPLCWFQYPFPMKL